MSDTTAVARADTADADALAAVAAVTFPLACPPGSTPEDEAAFIAKWLSPDRFREYVADPARVVLKAVTDGVIVGYALLNAVPPADPDVAAVITRRPVTELSKMYVLPGQHGNGVSGALMSSALEIARAEGSIAVWLGVNQENVRAQRFYGKHGFRVAGTKTFLVGAQRHHDYVMLHEF
ncbi:GNAT family N-acetyltransferase [Nocardia seriolae]|uniref:Acetyltransferase n=1 Tax=Nocardia seriolae TaxID=37332 RepID=A0ABC8B0V5_9NOCA|nr:GNAT family N-acetyltransferase [Nocardia seriolae]APA99862.1 tRNA (guanine(37)-N(1))-methyltransferase [Nocardia seriolae]MTJ64555.1 GNAT family N-acetyltransferase [Nocardia seriolae]MTJ73379.1 GNAT family N-acetyltransferase [Nocardia seriolae]MTJ89398.1 GNAT family N-acetyltransferase [Nocardia seriolae]MTK33374.1 GNAT family N-acetyltransferase [Nocardia seriolae]